MLISDGLGVLAAIFLSIPAVTDQYSRWKEFVTIRKEKKTAWPGLVAAVSEAIKIKRDAYNGWDSLFLIIGGVFLLLSFICNAIGY